MFGSKRRPPLHTMEELLAEVKPPVLRVPMVTIAQENEYRPCYVNGRRALFHRWANSARPQLPKGMEPGENARYFQFRSTHGLVEFEDGTVDLVWPRDIQFADGGHFRDYAWIPKEALQEEQNETR